MQLHYMPGSGALTIHLTLEFMGVDYQAIKITKTELKSPEYLKLNPQGYVPILLDGDLSIGQNTAIVSYLDAKFSDKNIFGDNLADKAVTWQWWAFCNSDLHKAFVPVFHSEIYTEDKEIKNQLKIAAGEQIRGFLQLFEKQLENKEYLAGFKSPADFYLFTILRWARHFKFLPATADNLNKFFDRLLQDEVVIKVLTEQGLKLA